MAQAPGVVRVAAPPQRYLTMRRPAYFEGCLWRLEKGFPRIRCTRLGVPIIRIIVFGVLHRGPSI